MNTCKTNKYEEYLKQESEAKEALSALFSEYCGYENHNVAQSRFKGRNWVTPNIMYVGTLLRHPGVAVELSYGDFSLESGIHRVMLGVAFKTFEGGIEVDSYSRGSYNIEDIREAFESVAALREEELCGE